MSPVDDDLRARFGELRATDAATAPGLSAVLHLVRNQPRRLRPRAAGLFLIGAAASIAALTFGVRQLGVQTRAKQPVVTVWRSPTSSLMPANPQTVLAPPPLLSSVLDGATSSTIWRKGD